jgi:hypothetical protein
MMRDEIVFVLCGYLAIDLWILRVLEIDDDLDRRQAIKKPA